MDYAFQCLINRSSDKLGCLHVKFGGIKNLLDVLTQYEILRFYGLVSENIKIS